MISPASSLGSVSTINSAPAFASLSNNVSAVSLGAMGTTTRVSMSPVSTPSFICIIVTPVSFSPLMIAQLIGAAPLYFGKSDAWIFTQPYFGISRISLDNICPKAATTKISACSCLNLSTHSGVLIFWGCHIVSPCLSAHSFTGGNCICPLLPLGLSGCVTTAAISCPASINASRAPTEKSGVPINTILKIIPPLLPNRHYPSIRLLPSPHINVRQDDRSHDKMLLPEVRLLLFQKSPGSRPVQLLLHG